MGPLARVDFPPIQAKLTCWINWLCGYLIDEPPRRGGKEAAGSPFVHRGRPDQGGVNNASSPDPPAVSARSSGAPESRCHYHRCRLPDPSRYRCPAASRDRV